MSTTLRAVCATLKPFQTVFIDHFFAHGCMGQPVKNQQKLLEPFNRNISPIALEQLGCTSMKNNSHSRCTMLKTLTFTLMHFCIAFAVTYALTGSIAARGLGGGPAPPAPTEKQNTQPHPQ